MLSPNRLQLVFMLFFSPVLTGKVLNKQRHAQEKQNSFFLLCMFHIVFVFLLAKSYCAYMYAYIFRTLYLPFVSEL